MNEIAEGSLLGEQTVLSFAPHPPSLNSSPMLPSYVCDKRGGEKGFAMNQKTQLQFNLGVAPDYSNLGTTFNPGNHNSPVIVEKIPSRTIGFSHTPVEAFKMVSAEKLTLAMKLAKRNLERRVSEELPSRSSTDDERGTMAWCDGNTDHTPQSRSNDDDDRVSETCLPQNREPKILKEKSTSKIPEEIKKQIGKLRGELQLQLSRMNGVKRSNTRTRPIRDQHMGVWSGRSQHVGRLDEGEENIEREKRRREEQIARNARMTYDLSQQVKAIQRMCAKTDPPTSQYILMRKLASTQRAALRTLQGYSGYGRSPEPIPPELSLVIKQLTSLSCQIGGGGAGNQLIFQLMENLEEQGIVRGTQAENISPSDEGGTRSVVSSNTKKRRTKKKGALVKANVRSKGVLIKSRTATNNHHHQHRHPPSPTRYDNQTFNSAQRQLPLHPYTPPSRHHSPPPCMQHSTSSYQGTPRLCYLHTPPPRHPHPRFINPTITIDSPRDVTEKKPLPHHSRKKNRKDMSDHTKEKYYKVRGDGGGDAASSDKSHLVDTLLSSPPGSVVVVVGDTNRVCLSLDNDMVPPDDSRNIHSAIAAQERELQKMREDISKKLTELDSYMREKRDKKQENINEAQPSNQPSLPQEVHPLPHAQGTKLSQNTAISDMLRILQELEAEEDIIRQRWTTIIYEDPLMKRPPIIHRAEEDPPKSTKPEVPALSPLSPDTLSSIEEYRNCYSHHLKTTVTGGRDQWAMAESIADVLLGDALEGVASEVEQLCDHYVEGMYTNEFIGPP